jgi:hypothetical protein
MRTHLLTPWPKAVASGPTRDSADPGLKPVQVHFGGKPPTTIPHRFLKVFIYTSARNCPWKSIKGGGALSFIPHTNLSPSLYL